MLKLRNLSAWTALTLLVVAFGVLGIGEALAADPKARVGGLKMELAAPGANYTLYGFKATEGTPPSVNWTTGNLGKAWSEGEWVPYKLVITGIPVGLDGLDSIAVSYDFTYHHSSDMYRFVDMVRGIQVGTTDLTDSQGWPAAGGAALPMTTNEELQTAQNTATENIWTGFTDLDLPDSQINRTLAGGLDVPPGTDRHIIRINKSDLLAAGVSNTASAVIIYFQVHLSRTLVWSRQLQAGYDVPPTDGWGGYLYGTDGWPTAAAMLGSGYAPGSSGHIGMEYPVTGRTVSLPIPEPSEGEVYGTKWFDINGDGIMDPGEPGLSGWEIHLSGTVESIDLNISTLTDAGGNFAFSDLTGGATWTIKEDAQRDVPAETGYFQTYPEVGTTEGFGTGIPVGPPPADVAGVGWEVVLPIGETVQTDINFGNGRLELGIVCPDDIIIECDESNDPSNTGEPVVEGVCPCGEPGGCPPVVTFSDEIVAGACPDDYTITRTWTASCPGFEVTATCVQTITVQDNTPPNWVTPCPENDFFECGDVPDPPTMAAEDNCDDNVSVVFDEVRTDGDCPYSYTLDRTWTATDDCGNSIACEQTITVDDITPPEITCPDGGTFECDEGIIYGEATATDNCDPDPTITFNDIILPGDCPGEFTVERTWTATDACDNSATCMQLLEVVDNTDPYWTTTCPADATVECDNIPDPPTMLAEDDCDPDVDVVFDEVNLGGPCSYMYTLIRTWTATDDCDNQIVCEQELTVTDYTPPVITCPDDVLVECDEVIPFEEATATDNCDPDPDVTYDDVRIDGDCPAEYVIERTWTAEDECYNTSSCVQTITVVDTTPPEFMDCPADITAECDDIPGPIALGAEDNCGPVSIDFDEQRIDGSCPYNYTLVRTWTAIDQCDNSAECVQNVTVEDTTDPYWTTDCPSDITAPCDDIPEPAAMEADDNCDPSVTVGFNEQRVNGPCAFNYTLVRTWTATDDCGNDIECVQNVTVIDNTPPQISCPSNRSFECDETIVFGQATATDNCDPDPVITFSDITLESDCPYTYTIERTWTATDDCGNSASCVQVVDITDNTVPTLICTDDKRIGCNEAVVFDVPTALDNCDPSPVVHEVFGDVVPGPGPCEESHFLVWQAEDACGNLSETCDQTIIRVVDNDPPTLVAQPNKVLACNDPVVFDPPGISDNCDPDPVLEVVSTVIEPGGELCEEVHTRCWVGRDACNNESDPVCQSVTVKVDTEGPVLTCAPDKTIPYGEEPVFDEPTFTDNCLVSSDIVETSNTQTVDRVTQQEIYVQCWIVSDDCGNLSNECCQTITVEAEPEPYCTFRCWDWAADCLDDPNRPPSTQPSCLRDMYFYDLYPEGVMVGKEGARTAVWTSPLAIEEFLCSYGIPKVLARSYVNPKRYELLGVLVGETLCLRLNRDYSCAGYMAGLGYPAPDACYGDFVLPGELLWFAGITVDAFLEVCDQVVSGNTDALLPYGANIDHLYSAAVYVNWLFSNCNGTQAAPPILASGNEEVVVTEPAGEPTPLKLSFSVQPNPLHGSTTMRLALPTDAEVEIAVYDIQGRQVTSLVSEFKTAGYHVVTWNGADSKGRAMASGVYFCRVQINNRVAIMEKLVKL